MTSNQKIQVLTIFEPTAENIEYISDSDRLSYEKEGKQYSCSIYMSWNSINMQDIECEGEILERLSGRSKSNGAVTSTSERADKQRAKEYKQFYNSADLPDLNKGLEKTSQKIGVSFNGVSTIDYDPDFVQECEERGGDVE